MRQKVSWVKQSDSHSPPLPPLSLSLSSSIRLAIFISSNLKILKGYFETREIRNLEKSCCQNSTLEVIDFDKTKDLVCSKNNIPSLKSCDALKFTFENERIDFIELKGLNMYLKYGGRANFNPNLDTGSQITNKITGFEINRKIEESLKISKYITMIYK